MEENNLSKNAHVISHSHWDREWYMPFEYHRAKLIELIDHCIELFETDEEFTNFYLDGHTVLVEDYLEVKPQNREKIKQYVKEGKFTIGPWYVLQDEFLTSSEANIRNLLIGMEIAEEFGKCSKLGYFPDAFGNAGQMPQIMKQAGMNAIAFGRGVKPTGINNMISEAESYSSTFSEMYWQSPDGSSLPAILFANWYNNAWEIPEDADETYWETVLKNVEKYASTNELLLMNGCDHQPVQKNLSKALKAANEKYEDYHFIHSTFEDYVEVLKENLPKTLSTVHGELTGQNTNGWLNLVNTASVHVDLKMMNKKCENLLENVVEPLAVIAQMLGKEYPKEQITFAWKMLMQNHPHDSICSCSCDEVIEEMGARFKKCFYAAEAIRKEQLEYISEHVDTHGFSKKDVLFTIMNPYAKKRNGIVKADVDLRRLYQSTPIHEAFEKINEELCEKDYVLVDQQGKEIPCTFTNLRARFGYDLPKDCFRKPYVAETVTVTFEAKEVPAMGYVVYAIRERKPSQNNMVKKSMVQEENTMENAYLKVEILQNGMINVTDKENGRTFRNLLQFEDLGDLGTEYTFIPVPQDTPICTGKVPAKIELVCDEEFLAEYKITTELEIPVSQDEAADAERDTYVDLMKRSGGRSRKTVVMPIISYISLERSGRSVKVRTELENCAKDHRLRVLFPTEMKGTQHFAESIFEMAKRENRHKETWTYPSGCERQQEFVFMKDESAGLGIGNKGLHEYEILEDNTIAITLVRAVGEMGDWGVFPTQHSQVQKKLLFEYEITPFGDEKEALEEFSVFQYDLQFAQIVKETDASFKNHQFLWEGTSLKPCTMKLAQKGNNMILRWANYSDREQKLTITKTEWIDQLYRSNVIEEELEELSDINGQWEIPVKPFEIMTVGCKRD